jgi:hypothetical protein
VKERWGRQRECITENAKIYVMMMMMILLGNSFLKLFLKNCNLRIFYTIKPF